MNGFIIIVIITAILVIITIAGQYQAKMCDWQTVFEDLDSTQNKIVNVQPAGDPDGQTLCTHMLLTARYIAHAATCTHMLAARADDGGDDWGEVVLHGAGGRWCFTAPGVRVWGWGVRVVSRSGLWFGGT